MKKLLVLLVMLTAMNASGQWQPDVRLTNDTASSTLSYNNAWCAAASGSVVHVVWSDGRDGNTEIYYKRSSDGGVSWGADSRLTINIGSSSSPSITVSGSNVRVVWQDDRNVNYEIYYKSSTDGGINWGPDTRLTNNISISWHPSIAVSGSIVNVVWQDHRDGNFEIYYKRSTDTGVSWGADTRLTNNSAVSGLSSVAVSGSVVHVVWNDNREGNFDIYYKRSTDAGISWGADTRLTNNTTESSKPSIAVSGSIVHIVYNDIQYKRSTDSGVNWSAEIPLTNNAVSGASSIAVSGSVVHVVWHDYRDLNYEIYYNRSTDDGMNWGADTRLTNNTANSWYPSIAVSGSIVHVVWQDYRDGNFEIYYKRDPTGNTVGIQNISSEIPSKYSLGQNYPNPFNPVTKIRFNVQKSEYRSQNSEVILKIFDALGREVETLVNERLQPGTYETSFDGSGLNSGVYFYKMVVRHGGSSTDGFTETKRMVLIK